MRNTLFLLSASLLIGACDEGETTAPRSRLSSPTPAASSQSLANSPTGGSPSAKPVDQVGWTKAVTYYSDPVTIPAGASQTAVVYCPAGTTPTGGGFYFSSIPPLLPPAVVDNTPFGSGTAWIVVVRNYAGRGAPATGRANVRCAR